MTRTPQADFVPRLITIVVLALVVIGPPLVAWLSARAGMTSRPVSQQVLFHSAYCALALLVVWIALRFERQPLASIGIRRPDAATIIGAALLCAASFYLLPLLSTPVLQRFGSDGLQAGMRTLQRMPLPLRLFVGATAGVVEETLYRGYAVERLAILTGRRWLGATLSILAFTLGHIPSWGLVQSLAADLPFGAMMTLVYLWRRDLIANMLAHSGALMIAMAAFVS